MNAIRPGELVVPVGLQTWARVARESLSTPRAFRHGPQSPGTTAGPSWPLGTGLIPLGQPVDPTGPWTRARDARDSWSNPWAFGPGPQLPGRPGRPHGTSDPSVIHPGDLVDPVGPRTQARVRPPRHSDTITRRQGQLVEPAGGWTMARGARPIWSTPRSFGPGPESPRTAGRSCRPSNHGHSRPGQLVNSAGHRT